MDENCPLCNSKGFKWILMSERKPIEGHYFVFTDETRIAVWSLGKWLIPRGDVVAWTDKRPLPDPRAVVTDNYPTSDSKVLQGKSGKYYHLKYRGCFCCGSKRVFPWNYEDPESTGEYFVLHGSERRGGPILGKSRWAGQSFGWLSDNDILAWTKARY